MVVVRVYWDFGPDALIQDWLYDAITLSCALLAGWRAVVVREDRAAWLLAALGLGSWWAGDLWWVLHAEDAVVPIPSLADAFYLAMYPPLAAAVILLVRARIGAVSRMLAVDGVIGAFAIAAISAAFVIEPVLENLDDSTATLLVTLAYPVCDIVLIAVLVEAVALGGWVLPRAWALLAAGLATFAVVDGIYYAQVANDTYVAYGLTDVWWLVATLLVAVAAWQPAPRTVRAQRLGWRHLAAPGVFSMVALGVAFYAYAARVNVFAMALACAALVAVIVRMVATFRENLQILAASQNEALTDALTGLGNRRSILADLDERLADGGRHVLLLCDLNGFKRYNDTFGHPRATRCSTGSARRSRRQSPRAAAPTAWAATSSASCWTMRSPPSTRCSSSAPGSSSGARASR